MGKQKIKSLIRHDEPDFGEKVKTKSDLIVYGAGCVWWDSIKEAVRGYPTGIPVCPHCGSILYQMEPAEWFANIKKFDREREPGYEAMWLWARGKCFPTMAAMRAAYAQRPAPTDEGKED